MKKRLNDFRSIDFIILSLIVILINIPFLQKPSFPRWDTAVVFEIYHFFYNTFYYNGEIARWMPYYSYGMPSAFYQIFTITPLSYLTIFLGRIFQIENVFGMFKLTFIGHQLIFLLGAYLLSKL